MVKVVSTESIRGIEAGKPGYSEQVSKAGTPIFRGTMSNYFESIDITSYPGSTSSSYLEPIPTGKEVQIKGIFFRAESDTLMKIILMRKIETEDSDIIEQETYSKQGYGFVGIENISVKFKGEERAEKIEGYGIVRVVNEYPGIKVIPQSPYTLRGSAGFYGVEKTV